MLVLVRHGLTQANADSLLLGRADRPLTDVGRAQAAAIARAVGVPGLVVSSPLQRARETAEAFGAPVEVDERWIEMARGQLQGFVGTRLRIRHHAEGVGMHGLRFAVHDDRRGPYATTRPRLDDARWPSGLRPSVHG